MDTARQKVTDDHLRRDAYLYIRQSTIQQVFHKHGEYAPPIRFAPPRGGLGLVRG